MVAADRAALTRLRRLVSSLIATEPYVICLLAQVKLVSAEMGLVLVLTGKTHLGWAWF